MEGADGLDEEADEEKKAGKARLIVGGRSSRWEDELAAVEGAAPP